MSVRLPIKYIAGASATALIFIGGWEAYRDKAYMPTPQDVPTIDFGRTRNEDGTPVRMGDVSDPVKGLQHLGREIKNFENTALAACVIVPLHQYEYDAYVSFSYNVGSANFCRSTLVKLLNEREYEAACAELDKWVFQGKTKLQGLVNRRAAERRMCEGKE